jgi:hypothetical protein
MNDWTSFGRIDDEGTVYVKTSTGERVVGSWHAGTPEEGLAHFARRFADIVTEVDLIEARLGSGAADPSHTMTSLRRIRSTLDEAHVVGDLDGLTARLEKLVSVAESKATESRAARDAARVEALARKTALVEEAERIAAESTQWKAAGDRLREILDEWKTIKGVDKRTDGELWKRYSSARDGFTRRRGTHFASLDAQRKQAMGRKDELVAEAESLKDSTDWAVTANRLKELMAEWKAAPRAAKDVEQKLWERFRADPHAAQTKLRETQAQWHDSGRVSRDAAAGLDRRLRAVDDKVRSAMDSAWRRTTPDSNPLLTQMRDQVAEAEARLARAQAAGDARRVKEAQQALDTKRRFLELAEKTS